MSASKLITPIHFIPGAIVQVRSGGPLLTVGGTGVDGETAVIYFNTISGLFEEVIINQDCLRDAHGRPEIPKNADAMRSMSITK